MEALGRCTLDRVHEHARPLGEAALHPAASSAASRVNRLSRLGAACGIIVRGR